MGRMKGHSGKSYHVARAQSQKKKRKKELRKQIRKAMKKGQDTTALRMLLALEA